MAEMLPGILAIWNDCAPGREAEFEEWFQHEHLAERLAVPGFLLGRRYEAVSGQPRYFNLYLTQSADVLKSAAYIERLNHPTTYVRALYTLGKLKTEMGDESAGRELLRRFRAHWGKAAWNVADVGKAQAVSSSEGDRVTRN